MGVSFHKPVCLAPCDSVPEYQTTGGYHIDHCNTEWIKQKTQRCRLETTVTTIWFGDLSQSRQLAKSKPPRNFQAIYIYGSIKQGEKFKVESSVGKATRQRRMQGMKDEHRNSARTKKKTDFQLKEILHLVRQNFLNSSDRFISSFGNGSTVR